MVQITFCSEQNLTLLPTKMIPYRAPLQEISKNNGRFGSRNSHSNTNHYSNKASVRSNKTVRFIFHPKTKPLGSGAYGTVFPAYDRILNKNVAIKVIRPQSDNALLCPTTIREIGLLKLIKHENIISLLDMNFEANKSIIYLVFERAHHDLKKFWNKYYKENNFIGNKKATIITISLIKHIMRQIINGISFLHSIKIIHRDIKPQNILLFISSNNGTGNGNG
eukprot:493144_1